MTDGWPLYESRLKGKLHVSKRYTQRIERRNLNLRHHLARLGAEVPCASKSVEQHSAIGSTGSSEHKTLSVSWTLPNAERRSVTFGCSMGIELSFLFH
jgi:hypothetical protein